ncbi:DUF3793 family protein [uncultured Clostridium sp.]|uniref:DUF3793 family protein n=1 Tax=uncultured Clostridium sp. TaxID=59620 RepID=UPI0026136CCB|nr:DUF3793 family protein [uncultured Clostridium sp.]
MSCTPKKCLLCGYWKVYNNCQSAINTFTLYDKARENLIDDILIARKSLLLKLIYKNGNITHLVDIAIFYLFSSICKSTFFT